MRKLSLFIIAAGATLGVAIAQADDTGAPTETPEVVPYLPPEEGIETGVIYETGGVDPVIVTDPSIEEPIAVTCDNCVETITDETLVDETVLDETIVEDTAVDETVVEEIVEEETTEVSDEGEVVKEEVAVTDESGTTDDSGATDDTGSTGESDGTEVTGEAESGTTKEDDTPLYMTTTTTDTISTRGPEGCMECRNLTGMADESAVEAPSPEVMADVLDGNATGVDVMDPVESKKRKQN